MKGFLLDVFAMDIPHMTPADWLGVIVTLMTFVALAVAYYKVFHPRNRVYIESHRYHLIDHDREVPYWDKEQRPTRIRHKEIKRVN